FPGWSFCTTRFLAVCGSLSQPQELVICCGASTAQSRQKLWLGELGCDGHRLVHRLIGRPPVPSGGLRLGEGSEKARAVAVNIGCEVRESATSRLYCFLQATSPDEDPDQLSTTPCDHPLIAESDINFQGLTEIGKRRVPSLTTSLRNRKAGQQVSSF